MRINKKTLLWEDLTVEEAATMRHWAEDVILVGKLAYPNPPWLDFWYKELGYNDDNRLLMQSTVVPVRVLLSVLYHLESII